MDDIKIKNAIITSTFLGREDHGIPTCYIQLNYGNSDQGFGGFDLRWWGIDFIQNILDTLEVSSWEKLQGIHLRVKADFGKVHAIGHFIKDKWFIPSELAEIMKKEKMND